MASQTRRELQQQRHDSIAKEDYLQDECIKEVATDIQQAVDESNQEKIQYERLISGFNILCVAAGFVAAIQSQLLGLTAGREDSPSIRAINMLFIGGMLIDIMAAMMGYLTIRFLERMRTAEQHLLNKLLERKTNALKEAIATKKGYVPEEGAQANLKKWRPIDFDSPSIKIGPPQLAHKFMTLSLLIPLPFLMIGTFAMLGGIYTYVWTVHPTVVAVVVSIAGASTLPFILCDFIIGRNPDRRRFIIRRICELQGDW